MKITMLCLALTLCLGGCATTEKTSMSGGGKEHRLTCSGTSLTWDDCYREAGKICGEKGYEVLKKRESEARNPFGNYGGSVLERTLIVMCKE